MSFALKNIIWPLFGKWEDRHDTYKVNGKGLNQRYNEILAEDFDDEILPYVDNMVSNLKDPDTMLERMIPFWEDLFNTPLFDEDIELRRKVLRYSIQFNKVAGTELGYKFLFGQVGIDCDVVELNSFNKYDKLFKYDVGKKYDATPELQFQTPYRLVLSGPEYLDEQIENIIRVVVKANEPADAKYIDYVYTTLDMPQFFDDTFFRNDFFN
jgi:hypothetical protein